jgi:hypothetical protein
MGNPQQKKVAKHAKRHKLPELTSTKQKLQEANYGVFRG